MSAARRPDPGVWREAEQALANRPEHSVSRWADCASRIEIHAGAEC
jgi:hypothetical protein